MILKSNAKFIWELPGDYTMSKAQARRIFIHNWGTFQCECWKRLKRINKVTRDGCDQTVRPVVRNEDGTMTIGCTTLTLGDIARAKRWLRSRPKVRKAKSARA